MPINFQALVEHKKLTSQGMEWLIAALDPFHDRPLHIAGYPDGHLGWSVCHPVKYRRQVVAPIAGDWDCLIAVFPLHGMDYETMWDATISGNPNYCSYDHVTSTTHQLSALMVCSNSAGGVLWPPRACLGASGTVNAYPLYMNATADAPSRLIAGGFEVIDVTPEFYKSGQCTVGVVDAMTGNSEVRLADLNAAPWTGTNETQAIFNSPPTNAAVATQVPNSVTWEAKKGAYVPLQLCVDQDRPYGKPRARRILMQAATAATSAFNILNSNLSTQVTHDPCQEHAHRLHFAVFSGLDQNVRLNIETRVFIESSVSFVSGVLDPVTLMASPTAPYDKIALDIYRRMLFDLPPGVPQSWNPAGEWFRKVLTGLSTVMKIAGPALVGLSAPAAALNPALTPILATGGALTTGASFVPQAIADAIPKKKKKAPKGRGK